MNPSNAPVAGRQKTKFSVAISTKGYQNLINNTIQNPVKAQNFIAAITSAVAVNESLQDCEPGSILASAFLGESLNLSPSPQLGQYYLVPFKRKEKRDRNGYIVQEAGTVAQFVLGYKGYIQLALRSGQYADLDVMEIKEGEYLGRDSQTGKPKFSFIEDDEEREQARTIGYMAYFEYLNGFRKVMYWSKEKMIRHADKYSPAFSRDAVNTPRFQKVSFADYEAGNYPPGDEWKYSSHWYSNFDGMAEKTMLRQLISKWGIMSTELQKAITQDMSISEVNMDKSEIVTTPESMNEPDEAPVYPSMPPVQPEIEPEAAEAVEQVDLSRL